MPALGKIDRAAESHPVDTCHWVQFNCIFCKNKKTCKLYDAIQDSFMKGKERLDFTANTIECPWLRV